MYIKNDDKEYRYENNLAFSCQYHVIFCPKYRRRVLDDDVAKDLAHIIYENQEKYKYKVLELEIMPDHVHLLLDVSPKVGVFVVICKIKGLSSRFLREKYESIRKRLPTLWTRSSFISTVGAVSLSVVKNYIENQKTV